MRAPASPAKTPPVETLRRPPARPVRHLLVFCGARPGHDPQHAALARAVGALLAARRVRLVWGGGALGLMGELGRSAIEAGGAATGIIPRFLCAREVAEPRCTDLRLVETLHARKAAMFEAADAVLALPGGLGTLDELVELLSWRNLGLHARPIWLLGGGGFWAPFRALLAHLVREGFAAPDVLDQLAELPSLDALAALLPAA
jgi:conserved hypothetical protein, DprA/Smf-related, family 2